MRQCIVLLLFALNANAQTLAKISTLTDENAYYMQAGWTWTASQLPSIPSQAYTIGSLNPHSDLEADDLWQNIAMWERTGVQGYRDLAAGWANYYKNTYYNDWVNADLGAYLGDHTFGWGLVRWSQITGDSSYLAEANHIADAMQNAWNGYSAGPKSGFYGHRGPGRQLKLAVALGRIAWATQMWVALRDGGLWDERMINGTPVGFFKQAWDQDNTKRAISSFQFGILADAMADYYDATQDPEVKRRLILMAQFAKLKGLHPTALHTGSWIVVDYPAAGNFCYVHYDTACGGGAAIDPFYTTTMIDTMVIGYKLSGDHALLDRAAYHWERFDHAIPGTTNRLPANQVGHFMNSQMLGGNLFYLGDGELSYGMRFFAAALGGMTPPITEQWQLLPNSSLRAFFKTQPYIVSPGPDGYSQPVDNIITDWNGGVVDTKRQRLILPALGGHTSWFYNDVWAYDIPSAQWLNLRKSYLPYIPLLTAETNKTTIYPDNSPATIHTYDAIAYDETSDSIFRFMGPGWSSSGFSPPPSKFSMANGQWTYTTPSPVYPDNGSCAARNPTTGKIWVNTSYSLLEYDPGTLTATIIGNNLVEHPFYATCLVVNGAMYQFGPMPGYPPTVIDKIYVQKLIPGQAKQTISFTGDTIPYSSAPGVAWESNLNRVIIWSGGQSLYLMDLAALTVTRKTISGENPGGTQARGTYKSFGRIGPGQYVLWNSLDAIYLATIDVGTSPPPNDVIPPSIPLNLTAIPLSAAQVALSWNASTDNIGVTGYSVERCIGAGCSSFTVIGMLTATSLSDANVIGNTTYSYRVNARDAAGNISLYSITATATTPTTPPPGDTISPTVLLQTPESLIIGGIVNAGATASDNVGVVGVQFKVDGINLGLEDTISPYVVPWNTTIFTNGAHTLTAIARDAAGNSTLSDPLVRTINNVINPPLTDLIPPSIALRY